MERNIFVRPIVSIKPIDKYYRKGIYNLFLVNNFYADQSLWKYVLIDLDGNREEHIYKEILSMFPHRFPKINWERALSHCNEYGGIYFDPLTGGFKAILPVDFKY
jgi:hypothetical protein